MTADGQCRRGGGHGIRGSCPERPGAVKAEEYRLVSQVW